MGNGPWVVLWLSLALALKWYWCHHHHHHHWGSCWSRTHCTRLGLEICMRCPTGALRQASRVRRSYCRFVHNTHTLKIKLVIKASSALVKSSDLGHPNSHSQAGVTCSKNAAKATRTRIIFCVQQFLGDKAHPFTLFQLITTSPLHLGLALSFHHCLSAIGQRAKLKENKSKVVFLRNSMGKDHDLLWPSHKQAWEMQKGALDPNHVTWALETKGCCSYSHDARTFWSHAK